MWFFNKKKALEIQQKAVSEIVDAVASKIDTNILAEKVFKEVSDKVHLTFMSDEHYWIGVKREIGSQISNELIQKAKIEFINSMTDGDIKKLIEDGIRQRVKDIL
jgi:hypothetical protein